MRGEKNLNREKREEKMGVRQERRRGARNIS